MEVVALAPAHCATAGDTRCAIPYSKEGERAGGGLALSLCHNPAFAEPGKEVIWQMKLGLAIAAAGMLGGALWANAFAAVDSGLKPGTFCTPFQVVDVTGPHKGQELCYR